jgi:hypothetical protein
MARLSGTAKPIRKRIMDQVLAEGSCPKVAEKQLLQRGL